MKMKKITDITGLLDFSSVTPPVGDAKVDRDLMKITLGGAVNRLAYTKQFHPK